MPGVRRWLRRGAETSGLWPGSQDTSFGGTSSAAAIIAGAAILVQEMAKAWTPSALGPAQMRSILSDPTTGTVVLAPSGKKKVGVMPDLKEIARKLKGPLPATASLARG